MENRTIAEQQTEREASTDECVGWRRVDDPSIAGCGKRDCDGPDYLDVTGGCAGECYPTAVCPRSTCETVPGVTRASE